MLQKIKVGKLIFDYVSVLEGLSTVTLSKDLIQSKK